MTTNPFKLSDVESALGGRYILGNEIGIGGQGVVYRAERILDGNNQTCKNNVALKLHLDPRQDARVEREIRAAKNLQHATLATLLEEGIIAVGGVQTRFIAWDFIEGESLESRLRNGPLTERETVKIALDVVSAITVLWSKKIVHRDIAPKNIMVRPNGHAVLIDLGGARHLDTSTITAPGFFFGTMGYLSPEQFRAEHALTASSDVFALGTVIFECLLGHHPTRGDQFILVTTPPSALTSLSSNNQELCRTIDKMLANRAPFRPTLAQLSTALERFRNAR
jgi:serine/threonine-protein kinase